MTEPLGWAVLGLGRIARRRMIPALMDSPTARIAALGSRDPDGATATRDGLEGLPHPVSYEAAIADPRVDAVYIALPNHLHVEWATRALAAGRHVLCEKPIGLNAAEADQLAATAAAHAGLLVMEAFMYRFHPQWTQARRLIEEGTLGDVRSVHTHFSYFNDDPTDIRNCPGTGGGALLDVGCYGVSVARWIFGEEPTGVRAIIHADHNGVDWLTAATLEFPCGAATLVASTRELRVQEVRITGSTGSLTMNAPFNPPDDGPALCRIRSTSGDSVVEVEPTSAFRAEAEAFAAAVRDGGPGPLALADSVANMRVLDAIRSAAERGGAQSID